MLEAALEWGAASALDREGIISGANQRSAGPMNCCSAGKLEPWLNCIGGDGGGDDDREDAFDEDLGTSEGTAIADGRDDGIDREVAFWIAVCKGDGSNVSLRRGEESLRGREEDWLLAASEAACGVGYCGIILFGRVRNGDCASRGSIRISEDEVDERVSDGSGCFRGLPLVRSGAFLAGRPGFRGSFSEYVIENR